MLKKINEFIKYVFHHVVKSKTENIFIQFFRYFVVSGIAQVADFLLTMFLNEILKIEFLIASRFGNVLGLIVNYILSVLWVFNKRKIKNKFLEFIIFLVTSLIGMAVNLGVEFLFIKILFLNKYFAKIVSVGIGYIVRFVLRKFLMF